MVSPEPTDSAPAAPPPAPPAAPRRRRLWLHALATASASLLLVVALFAAAIGWLIGTTNGMNSVIGLVNRLQGLARMARLGPDFLATGAAQPVGLGLLETIARRRFAAVAAVLGQLIFKGLDAPFQGAH